MSAGLNTLDLQRPIVAQEGDYYGYRIEFAAAANFFAPTDRGGSVRSYSVTDVQPGCSDFAWEAQPSIQGTVLPIEIHMRAPILVTIGDGTVLGNFGHQSFVTPGASRYPGTEITSYLGEQWRVTRQNMGIHAQTIDRIAARFTTDVVNLHPRIVLIGSHILLNSDMREARYFGHWKTILDACRDYQIKPVILLSWPITGFTAADHQQRERWNTTLRELTAGYPGTVLVDPSGYVGVERRGGPPGNRWDMDKAYAVGDGVHLNDAGNQRIVQAIVDQYAEP
jgi:hypothetical protein